MHVRTLAPLTAKPVAKRHANHVRTTPCSAARDGIHQKLRHLTASDIHTALYDHVTCADIRRSPPTRSRRDNIGPRGVVNEAVHFYLVRSEVTCGVASAAGEGAMMQSDIAASA